MYLFSRELPSFDGYCLAQVMHMGSLQPTMGACGSTTDVGPKEGTTLH